MKIKFCALHQIGYNHKLDAVCPQCILARSNPMPEQWDFDADEGKIIDPRGKDHPLFLADRA